MEWRERVRLEMEAELRERLEAEQEAVRTGVIPDDSALLRLTGDFRWTQYAPWFPDGEVRGGREEWIEGTRAAYASYAATGETWAHGDMLVLPVSQTEAVVAYEQILLRPDPAVASPRAVFLERYVKENNKWMLCRHTAEKTPGWPVES